MNRLKYIVPSLAFASGLFLASTAVSFGKPEYTKKEKKGCITCHTSASSKELNAVGKCYGQKKSLDECSAEKGKK